jgi:hypothetical protein
MENSNNIRSDIRRLVATYGLAAVHRELLAEMRETFEFLRSIYDPPRNNLVIPVAEIIPDRVVSPHLHGIPNVFVQDVPELELSGGIMDQDQENSEATEQQMVNPFPIPIVFDSNIKEIHIQQNKTEPQMLQDNGEKFSKQKHKEEVLKKRKELEEKGIKPESLLTKDNLQKWLSEGLSYMRIAREKVGIPENEISTIAKTLGLQSNMKRYIVNKKGHK